MRLLPQPAGRIVRGKILFKNEDLLEKTPEQMRRLRGDRIAMILQDPMVAMNQLLTIGKQLGEPFRFHDKVRGSLRDMCIELPRKVKVPAPESRVDDYPLQFSGGMSQRALIGMGIANNPDLLIADEPTTALDVTIAAQILKLMKEIQGETSASIILITHDLAAVAQICTRVQVMYAGRIVEPPPHQHLLPEAGAPVFGRADPLRSRAGSSRGPTLFNQGAAAQPFRHAGGAPVFAPVRPRAREMFPTIPAGDPAEEGPPRRLLAPR